MQELAFKQSQSSARDGLLCFLHGLRLIERPQLIRSMLDVGCGAGHFVALADMIGIQSTGWDICAVTRPVGENSATFCVDLTDPQKHPEVDLVLCMEVAEHLPAEAADTLVANCVNNLKRKGLLLFSAATPGQGGAGHINEQPEHYWKYKLENSGMHLNQLYTTTMRSVWSSLAPNAWWYGKNIMVWEKM